MIHFTACLSIAENAARSLLTWTAHAVIVRSWKWRSNKHAGSNYVTHLNESKQDFGVSLNLLCGSKSLLCKFYNTLKGECLRFCVKLK